MIIGAQRCGTTTLYCTLALHPQIFLVRSDEEPKFFSREQEYSKGTEYYLEKFFRSAGGHIAVGEKSTEYMENLSVAERVYKFNPDMKLLYILRNPVERAISNYWFSVYNKLEDRQINDALRSEFENYLKNPSNPTRLYSTKPHAYIYRSLYYDNLKSFHDLFPKKNIKCIVFEEFIEDTKKIIMSIYLFLGVKDIDLPEEKIKPQRSLERKEKLDTELYDKLKNFFYEKNLNLPDLTGKDIWQFWL